MFYGNCKKLFEDFVLNFGDNKTGCCITTAHRLTLPFHEGILGQKQHDCHPPPALIFSVSPFEDEAERPPF
jgi:hypothetical protein